MNEIKAGRWSTAAPIAMTLLLIVTIIVATLGCGVVEKVAGPVDRAGCRTECALRSMTMHDYVYETDSCWCRDGDGELWLH